MKKRTFTLLLASFMTLSLLAADITNRITVSFAGNRNYELRIDGRRYNSSSNRIYLNDLRPGRHNIEVYELNNRSRRSNRPVYASSFTVRPRYDMHITIDRNGQARINESKNGNRNDRDWDDRDSRDWNESDDRYETDRNWNNNSQWEAGRALNEGDYNNLVAQVRRQWSASSKYNEAKEAVARYYLSTQQVRGLLELLSQENYRLDVAKLAYRNTVDKQAYTQLYPLFSRSAQAELDSFIRSNRY